MSESLGPVSKRCFVIAPIGKEDSEIRRRSDQIFSYVIKPAVERLGYEAVRGDQISQPGMINSQVFEHLLEDELAITDLTGKNPNVYYELAVRHAADKPVISIKDVSESLAFDVVGMRTIDVDFRFIDSMEKCKEEIVKQIQAIESGISNIDSPIKFTKQAKLIDHSISEAKIINSEIQSLKQGPAVENVQEKIKNLTDTYNSKILQAMNDLPRASRVNANLKDRVLWVDDYPANNKAVMDIYRRQGIKFDLALDTPEALDYLSKNSYDLIISDLGRGSEPDAGIKMIYDIKMKYSITPPIIIYGSDKGIERYGYIAKRDGASFVTASARDLVLTMNQMLNLQ